MLLVSGWNWPKYYQVSVFDCSWALIVLGLFNYHKVQMFDTQLTSDKTLFIIESRFLVLDNSLETFLISNPKNWKRNFFVFDKLVSINFWNFTKVLEVLLNNKTLREGHSSKGVAPPGGGAGEVIP